MNNAMFTYYNIGVFTFLVQVYVVLLILGFTFICTQTLSVWASAVHCVDNHCHYSSAMDGN